MRLLSRLKTSCWTPAKYWYCYLVMLISFANRVKDCRTLHRTFNVDPLYLKHENSGLNYLFIMSTLLSNANQRWDKFVSMDQIKSNSLACTRICKAYKHEIKKCKWFASIYCNRKMINIKMFQWSLTFLDCIGLLKRRVLYKISKNTKS